MSCIRNASHLGGILNTPGCRRVLLDGHMPPPHNFDPAARPPISLAYYLYDEPCRDSKTVIKSTATRFVCLLCIDAEEEE